jgi:hydroxyacylglutathione hydrolase
MNLVALPAFADNYIWMLHDGRKAVVVDPGDAAPVVAALDRSWSELAAILVTHHHADHVGGVDALRPRLQGPVYGPAREAIPQPFTPLNGGDRVDVLGLRFEVIDVPGHTAGHIAYAQRRTRMRCCSAATRCSRRAAAGCSKARRRRCTHRCRAGRAARRHPGVLHARVHAVQPALRRRGGADNRREAAPGLLPVLRAQVKPTLPSTLALERQINPFLRCREAGCGRSGARAGAAATETGRRAGRLREWKNRFR